MRRETEERGRLGGREREKREGEEEKEGERKRVSERVRAREGE
jgi:hypothetical protein